MYVRDHARPEFHKAIGINPTDYDFKVFHLTSEISKQVFPLTLDVDNPKFKAGLERLRLINDEIGNAQKTPGFMGRMKRLALGAKAGATFLRLYFVPVQHNELPQQIRLEPVW
jgi:magnesium-protoporphyrin IX monomethyl ester (oxidative) cyclase